MKNNIESIKEVVIALAQAHAPGDGNQHIIDSYKQAAAHHLEAAHHLFDAAKHQEDGSREKASYSKLLALGHHTIAGEFMSDDAKHHAQVLKQTGYHV